MATGDHVGPALTHVEPDDGQALSALFREQRARCDVVREQGLWQWFGGVPSGRVASTAALRGLHLQLLCVGLVGLGLVLAGFTRGPWLWATFAAAALCLAVRALFVLPALQRTRRFFARAVQAPAVVVEALPAADGATNVRCVAALTAVRNVDPAKLGELVAAADRLRRLVLGPEVAPDDLSALVRAIRQGSDARIDDGSRIEVPPSLGGGDYELARLAVPIPLLPRAAFTSRLLFVLLDPESRARGHTRIAPSSLWGRGVETLCAKFPLAGRVADGGAAVGGP